VALVVDNSAAMAVWRKTVDEFQRLLERHGAFRDVRRWDLGLSPQVRLTTPSDTEVSPGSLLDPAGHRLIILFTQGTHSAWRQRQLATWLWRWAASAPVVIAQALPESLWPKTRLGETTPAIQMKS
jgi:hypothetical protein